MPKVFAKTRLCSKYKSNIRLKSINEWKNVDNSFIIS